MSGFEPFCKLHKGVDQIFLAQITFPKEVLFFPAATRMDSHFTYYHHDQSLLPILADDKPGEQWPRAKLPEKVIILPEEIQTGQDFESEIKVKDSSKDKQFVWDHSPMVD